MSKKQNILAVSILITILIIIVAVIIKLTYNKEEAPLVTKHEPKEIIINDTNSTLEYKLLHRLNKEKDDNYLISPYSIMYALSMANEGANNNTKNQISSLINNNQIEGSLNVKDRITLANGLFIKNDYKNDINNDFIKKLKSKYNSDVIYDDFTTPQVLNNWVNEKTKGMIPKIIDRIDSNFVLSLTNAIAIDIEWKNKFEGSKTSAKLFTTYDNQKKETAFMSSDNDFVYIKNDNATGIIKDYKIYNKKTGEEVNTPGKDTIEFEYIAILPNNDIKEYINNFNNEELENLLQNKTTSENADLYLNIPKYKYDFKYDNLKSDLIELGMKDAFDENADFTNMINNDSDISLSIDDIIHSTHIEMSENGTKASAVTSIIMKNFTSMEDKKNKITITFNKPFLYLIREKNTNNIWFLGTIYNPLSWEENQKDAD